MAKRVKGQKKTVPTTPDDGSLESLMKRMIERGASPDKANHGKHAQAKEYMDR